MITVQIQKPIWNGELRCRAVGIAEFRMKEENIKVEILYKNRHGERSHPDSYYITRTKAMTYPVQIVRNGVKLRIIQLKDLDQI